ncbi:hypothetical protein ACVZ7L_004697 [Salmonella enterica subsp. enterica serovar Braenderup]
MTEPRIEKLFGCDSCRDKKFRRADVAEEVVKYFGDDFVDSAHYIRAGRILKEGIERGVIKKIGSARYIMITPPSMLTERNMDESRKQFQSWFADEIVGADVEFPEFEDGEYVAGEIYDEQLYVMLQAMYMAWTASRAAIKIELLDINQYLAELENKTLSLAFRRLAENVRAGDITTIRAAGIKVKE